MNDKDKIPLINKIRYVLLAPVILVIGIITSPLTLLFRWNGFYILCIAIYHWCPLSKAKKLFLENKDGKYTIIYGSDFKEISPFSPMKNSGYLPICSSSSMDYLRNSSSYSYSPSNIYYSPSRR